ncbi:MAG TPA: hypothetical protein PK122_05695 [Candidatus Paceibacterota bacterium]|nr:hypothetical protein [Candidatus Paceibacterota bacterium]
MNFERGKDPKEALGIGIEKAVLNIIRRNISDAVISVDGEMRKHIIREIEKFTGWREAKHWTSMDQNKVFRFINPKDETKIIVINLDYRKDYA